MRCPFCTHETTEVKDSRPADEGNAIRRRRVCPSCEARWTTFERVALRDLTVIKRSGRRVTFDRDKLSRSIWTAVGKRDISVDVVESTIARTVRILESSGDEAITSNFIGETALRQLKLLDDVAYVRFASVFLEFTTAGDFAGFLARESLA